MYFIYIEKYPITIPNETLWSFCNLLFVCRLNTISAMNLGNNKSITFQDKAKCMKARNPYSKDPLIYLDMYKYVFIFLHSNCIWYVSQLCPAPLIVSTSL